MSVIFALAEVRRKEQLRQADEGGPARRSLPDSFDGARKVGLSILRAPHLDQCYPKGLRRGHYVPSAMNDFTKSWSKWSTSVVSARLASTPWKASSGASSA